MEKTETVGRDKEWTDINLVYFEFKLGKTQEVEVGKKSIVTEVTHLLGG
jgi:hypothetical protein